jgi:hypothetical protein
VGFLKYFCLDTGLLVREGFSNLWNEPPNAEKHAIGCDIPFAIWDWGLKIGLDKLD